MDGTDQIDYRSWETIPESVAWKQHVGQPCPDILGSGTTPPIFIDDQLGTKADAILRIQEVN